MARARRRIGGQARIDKRNAKPEEETPAPEKKTAPAKRPPGRPRKQT